MTSFPFPYLAFETPVPPPPVEGGGDICIKIDRKWIPYIIGLFKTLVIDRTWESEADRATGEANNLLIQFMLADTCIEALPGDEENCLIFSPAAPFIDWNPQDPYREPDLIPPGYIAVPWIVITPGHPALLLPGINVGDVITGFLSFPVLTPAIGEGLARFRVNVVGEGTIELHFVNVPFGGYVLVTVDDDLIHSTTVDLNKQLSLPPETASEIVYEVKVTGDGNHHVDCNFIPFLQIEETPLVYGGGLRSVVLCGFEHMSELFNVRQSPELPCKLEKTVDGVTWTEWADITKCVPIHVDSGGNIVITIGDVSFSLFGANTSLDSGLELDADMKIRKKPTDPCVLQLECAPGEWTDWYDPRPCIPGFITQPTDGDELDPGTCREWDVVLRGNERWLMPVAVQEGDTLQVTGAAGAWSDGTPQWNCVDGRIFILGGCTTDDASDVGDPLASVNHMRLIVGIDGTFYDAFNTTNAVPGTVTDGVVEFQANDGSLNDNSGSVSFHVKVCRLAAVPETVNISYDSGTGLTTLPPSENSWIVNMTSADAGSPNGNWISAHFSIPVKITVQSTSGFVNRCAGACLYSAVQLGGSIVESLYEPAAPTSMTPGLTGDAYGIATGNDGGTPANYTVQLLVERL